LFWPGRRNSLLLLLIMRLDNKKKGFSLIETIIYVTLVVVVLLVVIDFGWQSLFGYLKTQETREIQQNGRFALETIGRLVREANSINSPSPGDSDSVLSLSMENPSLDPTRVEVVGNEIQIESGTGEPISLTSKRVEVEELIFTNLSYNDTPGTVRVELRLTGIRSSFSASALEPLLFGSTFSLLPGGATSGEPGSCEGTPQACDIFTDSASCLNQDGCQWSPGSCQGDCVDCKTLGMIDCLSQEGCRWHFPPSKCLGRCASCDAYIEMNECQSQMGCYWEESYCYGQPLSCDNYASEVDCVSQEGCSWVTP